MYDMKNLVKFEKLGQLIPQAFKAFLAFDELAFKAGAIPGKYKELMAVAVALTTQCPYCIEIHARRAGSPAPPRPNWPRQPWSPPRAGGEFGHARDPHARMMVLSDPSSQVSALFRRDEIGRTRGHGDPPR